MPRVQRSPPATPQETDNNPPIFSTPDLFSKPNEPDTANITSRTKRQRPDYSPECEVKTFEDKIMKLFTAWKTDQESLLKKLTSELTEIKLQNVEIQKTNAETLKTVEFLSQDYDSIKKSLQKLETENNEQRNYIVNLEKKIEDLQSSSRSACIEIRNVPEVEKETAGDLTSIVLKTFETIQPSENTPQLRDVYRLPGKKGSSRPIVAEFLTVPSKIQVLEACRAFNKGLPSTEKLNTGHIGVPGQVKPVYIADHLPRSQRQLFFEARSFAKTNKYKFCWSQNGKIFLRKSEGMDSVIIRSTACLKKLLTIEK
ncbi:uncharacterized protein LOC124630943 [Helicoverpa zea]|uniref:uncharacterized protein LOC124630943 n=1 Tax=Helicoverpa zea TaxID=7113 RepID=UPI001F57E9C8|nr:uncharacterized protein LOC124630943 [Helicoverpa zea]